jgi:signal transduction histidine kinase
MQNLTAERLKRLSPEIMSNWVERTLQEVKASNLQETLALRDSLPIYLSQLVDALKNTIDRTAARNKSDLLNSTRIGKKHGRERAVASEYTMDQMILEYHILRQVICDEMEKEEPLSPVEREVIVCSIEQAVNDAATQFSDTLRDFQEQLSHTLVHDLRNPLSTVKISAQVLAKQITDQSQLEKIKRILLGAERIDEMVQEILDESKVKAGLKEVEFKECDLSWLIKDIAYELNISNADRFVVNADKECIVLGNENYIRRMIENLATNAIKYGNENSQVTLSISKTDDMGIIKVHNQGNPIPIAEQPTLFQKFRRGASADRKIGWGIGLNVVKTIVDIHHGSIEVESEEKSGTAFIITIPLKH